MMQFYPALLKCGGWDDRMGCVRWEGWMVDFFDCSWSTGISREDTIKELKRQLQAFVDGVEDHRKLPHPSHHLVVEAKLVKAEAHGTELIGIKTNLESDIDWNHLVTVPEKKEKKDEAQRKGKKKKQRRSRSS